MRATLLPAQTNTGYEAISTAQGLSQGLINDMIQDKEGFIWIATKGGLNRYDGYGFKIFTTNPHDTNSISSNTVSNLLEDSRGNIWIGTYDAGINVYNKKTSRFTRIRHQAGNPNGISGNRIVSAMLELPGDRILVCPQGGSLNIIALSGEGGAAAVVKSLNVPLQREVLGIGRDDKGCIWVGCTDASIFIFDPVAESFEMLSNGETFTDLIEKTGTLLSARASQVYFLNPTPNFTLKLFDENARIHAGLSNYLADGKMLLDHRIPLKTGSAGSVFYDVSSLKKGAALSDLPAYSLANIGNDETIKCILVDRSGVLWLGMLGQGLYKYHLGAHRFNPLLPKVSVQRVSIFNNNLIYVHEWSSVQALSPGGASCANPLRGILGLSPSTNVLQSRSGEYWAYNLVKKKLFRYTEGLELAGTYVEPVNPTPTEQLQPMIEDSRHRIWVCGANGTLAMVDPATNKLSRFVIPLEKGTVTSALAQTSAFYEDGAGVFWMGTENGFVRIVFSGEEAAPGIKWFRNVPGNRHSLSYNYVSWFMDDPVNADYLWISTKGGGLNRLQKSTGAFTHYSTRQGLPNDVVYGTLADNAGNIWGSTNRGLFCMLRGNGQNNSEPRLRVFSTTDGLQADEFNTNAFGKLTNGDLVFGGVNGINIFNPQRVLKGSFTPNVFITSIQIGNRMLAPGDKTGVLTAAIEHTKTITLNYLQDVVTLEFSSLDFSAPQQNKYRYQMIGIDDEWVESGTRRTATYLHLPAGKYLFKVQGSNSQGVWSNKIAELEIKVLPPWWRTWWAYLVYSLLLAVAISAYLRFNVNKARLQSQLSFEQLEAKRAKELDSVKTQLYTNITHEFRTPLTVILGMAQQVIEKPAEQFQTRMEMIIRNGRGLLNLVNEMLDLSKLETGKMQLQLSQGDVIHFLRYLVESFHSLAESQQKQLHFLTDIDNLFIEYDQEKLKQIVSNLLSNAIKFTPERGNIYINVIEMAASENGRPATWMLKVKDTGIGIPEDQLQYIFDRFYQLDNSHTRKMDGTGIGLALTKELVKLMEGEITVKSPPAGALRGSEFTVVLPLRAVAGFAPVNEIQAPKQTVVPALRAPGFELPNREETKSVNVAQILLVEDNADVVAYTASCLPEYKLAVGKDGREGFDIATDIIPDLVITDVMMPFVDGFELVRRLRQHETTSHIPVIMLTAKADINSKIEGLQQGVDAYLEKPFNKEELLVRIQKLLESRKTLQQYYLRQAGLTANAEAVSIPVTALVNMPAIEDAFVLKVRAAVEQNLTDANFSVQKLSKLVFMSHSQLHRKLDALTGCSPNKFIRMIRLKKAMARLQDPSESIASVALDCGFNDPGYFARVFKQEYGTTPQEWRAANTNPS